MASRNKSVFYLIIPSCYSRAFHLCSLKAARRSLSWSKSENCSCCCFFSRFLWCSRLLSEREARGDAGLTLTAYVIVHSFGQRLSTGEPLVGMGLVHVVLHHAMPMFMAIFPYACHRYILHGTLRLPKRQGWCSVRVLSGTLGHSLTRSVWLLCLCSRINLFHSACFSGEAFEYCLPLQNWGAAHLRAPGRPCGLWPMTWNENLPFSFYRKSIPSKTKRVFPPQSMACPMPAPRQLYR